MNFDLEDWKQTKESFEACPDWASRVVNLNIDTIPDSDIEFVELKVITQKLSCTRRSPQSLHERIFKLSSRLRVSSSYPHTRLVRTFDHLKLGEFDRGRNALTDFSSMVAETYKWLRAIVQCRQLRRDMAAAQKRRDQGFDGRAEEHASNFQKTARLDQMLARIDSGDVESSENLKNVHLGIFHDHENQIFHLYLIFTSLHRQVGRESECLRARTW